MVTQTYRGKATLDPPSIPLVFTSAAPVTPLDQFTLIIPSGTKKFLIKPRTQSSFLVSFDVSFIDYISFSANSYYSEENILVDSMTIYLKCSVASTVMECITWS